MQARVPILEKRQTSFKMIRATNPYQHDQHEKPLNPKPLALNPKTLKPKPQSQTMHRKVETPNPKPSTATRRMAFDADDDNKKGTDIP